MDRGDAGWSVEGGTQVPADGLDRRRRAAKEVPMAGEDGKAWGMTIGALAKAADVSVETVRFYERRDLIEQPPRPYGGVRRYPESAVRRLQFIKHAKSLGFTLNEIGDMVALSADDPSTCGEVQRLAQARLALLREKHEALRFMESVLEALLKDCRHAGARAPCPILEAVEEGIGEPPGPSPKR